MIASLIGSIERTNRPWDARAASPILTLVGSIALDFRGATLGEGESEIVVASLVGSVEITLPEDLPVAVTGLTMAGRRCVLGESSSGLGHGADYTGDDFRAATGRRLRLAVFSGAGEVEIARAPALVAPEPEVAVG
jgi:predicted membrane protein